ncbi:MAG TPA: hypothetical protein VLE53_17195 [Gemmatimonadaceae bacterium]|nr:hypothetical protein [Gemmatimonadaceae bacterium]
MSDDRFDEWVREAAEGYNHPGPVPREAMWQAIAAARRSAEPSGDAAPDHRLRGPRTSGTPIWRLAAAAMLLVAVGIGIGYQMRDGVAPQLATAPAASAPSMNPEPITGYEVKAAEHFTAAEMLLTSFQATRDAETAVAVRDWARSLLSSTRLLLDSPAATDEQRRRLLEDLERILVQIMQLAPDAPASDREYLERTITRGEVLTRIRTSIPAGLPSGT